MKNGDVLFKNANKEMDSGNFLAAFALFKASWRQGNILALNSIGYLFDHGIGLPPDQNAAAFWYRKAAKAGDVCAFNNLGLMYKKMGNIRRAIFWLRKAVVTGDGDAALEIAKIYLHLRRHNAFIKKYLKIALNSKSVTDASIEEANQILLELS